jgi:hypothetical protein
LKIKKLTSSRNPKDIVTLIAVEGDDTKEFLVHKEFACHYSPTLNAAFNSTFIEGQTQTYCLENTSEGVVRLLIQWLYTQKLDIVSLRNVYYEHDNEDLTEQSDEEDDDENLRLAQLWVLADQLLIPKLQNLVLRIFDEIRIELKILPVNCFSYVYENTSKDSKIRLYFLHHYACYTHSDEYAEYADFFSKEMLLDLAIAHAKADEYPKERISRLKRAWNMEDWSQYEVSEKW